MQFSTCLPADWRSGRFLGRLDFGAGPTPVSIVEGELRSLYSLAPTVSGILERFAENGAIGPGETLVSAETVTVRTGNVDTAVPATMPRLLSPLDLHCIKAAGVTFAASTLERIIEERAKGEPQAAMRVRKALSDPLGGGLRQIVPGSTQAAQLKQDLLRDGLWSQYLEVAIGPDAEIFTKGPPLSSVGTGDRIGIRSDSIWNNPEPEVVIICDSRGQPRGATLGNDVNLRDFEGRSALLLGKAKDNNASCAVGPFIRLFGEDFSMDDVRAAQLDLDILGPDGFHLRASSDMRRISRDPLALIAQAFGSFHAYPDGFALFLGTMFAPTEDRDTPGEGFTHKPGDIVTISSQRLGRLQNTVAHCEHTDPWMFGINALIANILQRQPN
ncbi:MAG: fumarylacetoacetate hydrolase family protein [Alphaproteobacteria bacterium]|nr:fumarylacetoacetate hydrolase family protein [Alphaproteobacteria bacterium]